MADEEQEPVEGEVPDLEPPEPPVVPEEAPGLESPETPEGRADLEPPEPQEFAGEDGREADSQPSLPELQATPTMEGMAGPLFGSRPARAPTEAIPPTGTTYGVELPGTAPLPHDPLPPPMASASPLGQEAGRSPDGDNAVAQQIQALTAQVQGMVSGIEEIKSGIEELKSRPSAAVYG